MMRSNIVSRLLPSNAARRSIYEELRAHDEDSEEDLEERAAMALDEENLRYHDDELETADVFNGEDSRITTESTAFLGRRPSNAQSVGNTTRAKSAGSRSRWIAQSPRLLEEEGDDDVPASLLIEGNATSAPVKYTSSRARQTNTRKRHDNIPTAGPSSKETRAQWEAAQAHQQLHHDVPTSTPPDTLRQVNKLLGGSARDKAMWRWINVVNLDNFIMDVYDYYRGAGMWCIVLERVLTLMQKVFVAIFVTFLTQCVSYNKIPTSKKLSEVIVPQCTKKISGMTNLAIWAFTLFVFFRAYQVLADMPRLTRLREFYEHLLAIPDSDMQTISWQDIVARIMALRDENAATVGKLSPRARKYLGSQSKQRLDAHDIANRLMRRENYMIAMFNKELLDLNINLPFLRDRQLSSKTFVSTLDWCIMDLVFNEQGQVRQLVLKDSRRKELSNALRNRFLFAGYMHLITAPLTIVYLLVIFFLQYFNEYQKNPSAIGSRQYTTLAEWKFREFNEVQHLFEKRVNMSYPFATRYLDQFPKKKMTHFARFVAFVAGAFVSVLAVASLLDPELFLNFEITPDRTVLFYIGIFGTLWAFMNGSIPDENLVFEPEYALRNVIEYTRYMPTHWEEKLHSDEVKREFAGLYQLRVMIFLDEILSIVFTPLILWRNLLKSSDQIIDFFREFTIHVDGVGYVCSFAVFDFKQGDGRRAAPGAGETDVREDYYSTKYGKMAASYYGFLDNYLLNPKTGVQGHVPPGVRHQFHHPPSYPGLASPTLAADMQASRMGRSERRPANKNLAHSTRTPRFAPINTHSSPMPSILLDPHHQPSASGFGGRSVRHHSRTRRPTRQNIVEEAEDGEDNDKSKQLGSSSREDFEAGDLGESNWELSPTKAAPQDAPEESGFDGGVLGLLYQFQKAQKDRLGPHG